MVPCGYVGVITWMKYKTKSIKIIKIWWKKGNNSRWVIRFTSKYSGTPRDTPANPVVIHEWGKDCDYYKHIHGHLWHIFCNGKPSHCGESKTFQVMTPT
jgi:hypothetical protein